MSDWRNAEIVKPSWQDAPVVEQEQGSTLSIPAQVGEGIVSIGRKAIAEPFAGLAGIAGAVGGMMPGGESPSEKGARFVEGTRAAVGGGPATSPGGAFIEEGVGKVGEVGVKAVRAPVAGIAGLAQGVASDEPFAEAAAGTINRVMDEGIGPTAGSALAEAGAPPAVSAFFETLPTGIATVLGVRGVTKVSPQVTGLTDDLTRNLKVRNIDPTDASPENLTRISQVLDEVEQAQTARVQTLRDVGIDKPTKAQVTRTADDFQLQQETAKRSGAVRDRLEAQEGQLAQTFDRAVEGTQGRPVTSGSTVIDEVVGRSTKLDNEISNLYKKARAEATGEVDVSGFAKKVIDNLDSDGAAGGLFNAVRGELKRRGVIDEGGNIIGKVDVATAEEIRKFVNAQFDARNRNFANTQIRELKDALDNDVFKAAGRDIFLEARKAKIDFEEGLSNAKISKFDKNNRSLVRDILENKIDPDALVERISSTKSYRAKDLEQLRDYLQQTEKGTAAFDDLRAQVLQNIRDKAFVGPVDANGVQALSRAALEKQLNRIGKERLAVLFTVEERALLNKILAASRIREPVRGTALGRGPSAQAIEAVNKSITDLPFIGRLFEGLKLSQDGKAVLSGRVQPNNVATTAPPQAALVPLAAGSE